MKYLLICWIPLFGFLSLKGQTDLLFSELNQAQQGRLKHIFDEQRDSVMASFEISFHRLLASEGSCQELPDTSLHYILVDRLREKNEGVVLAYALMNQVVLSTAGNLRVWSYDDLGGGSFHSYVNYLQYQTPEGAGLTFRLDTLEEDHQVGYYRAEQRGDQFLLFGYGTYGGGTQHFVIRLFEYKDGQIRECFAGYPDGKPIFIGSNRSQKVDLLYHPRWHSITWIHFPYDDDKGFYGMHGRAKTLVWKKGRLVRK
ncbi:MAG: hypothetical protein H6581_15715 [Bacteroidia bacterium]|nr:hypothetical protein [Bacteroidia bacterium]